MTNPAYLLLFRVRDRWSSACHVNVLLPAIDTRVWLCEGKAKKYAVLIFGVPNYFTANYSGCTIISLSLIPRFTDCLLWLSIIIINNRQKQSVRWIVIFIASLLVKPTFLIMAEAVNWFITNALPWRFLFQHYRLFTLVYDKILSYLRDGNMI